MNDLGRYKEFFLGSMLTAMTWEAWQDILVSLTIAFLGGFLAMAGKSLWLWCNRSKKKTPPKN